MNLSSLRLRIIVICTVSVLTLMGTSQSEITDRIVAKVGTDIITLSEVEDQARQSELNLTPETKKQVLSYLIDRVLLIQAAKKEKISIPENRINLAVDREIARIRSNFPSYTDFKNWVQQQDMTMEDLKVRLTDRVTGEILIGQVLRKKTPDITDIEVNKFSKEKPDEALKQQTVRIRQIFFSISAQDTPDKIKEINDKAMKVYHELKAGGRFEDLVTGYSEDSGTRDEGGDMGYLTHGEILPEIEKVAFQLEANQISEPIQSAKGIHIIQVTEKASTREYLYQQALVKTQEKMLADLRIKIPITIKLD